MASFIDMLRGIWKQHLQEPPEEYDMCLVI